MDSILERVAAPVRRDIAEWRKLGYHRSTPVTPRTLALAAVLVSAAPAARAGEAACWFENGVVVVPAQVMGVSGDFILDTGQARTQLAETQAQTAGFEATALTGEVRLAGQRLQRRAVAVADSTLQRGGAMTMGLLPGQDVLTLPTIRAKLDAQLRGLGGGFLPEPLIRPYVEAGRLVMREAQRPTRKIRMSYAWRNAGNLGPGRALQWWLSQLERPATRQALLERHRHP